MALLKTSTPEIDLVEVDRDHKNKSLRSKIGVLHTLEVDLSQEDEPRIPEHFRRISSGLQLQSATEDLNHLKQEHQTPQQRYNKLEK